MDEANDYDAACGAPTQSVFARERPRARDHVFGRIEDMILRSDRYWVVQKQGTAAELAARVDPRRRGLRVVD